MGYRWTQDDLDKAKIKMAGSAPIKLPVKIHGPVETIPSKMNEESTITESIYVGIDPDVSLSGFATWHKKTKTLQCYKFDLFDLQQFLLKLDKRFKVMVTIEAGWLEKKKNWHRTEDDNDEKRIAKNEAIAAKVGRNHEVGRQITLFCEKNNIRYLLQKPRGKVTTQDFKKYTKYTSRINQDQRDAAMLVYGL